MATPTKGLAAEFADWYETRNIPEWPMALLYWCTSRGHGRRGYGRLYEPVWEELIARGVLTVTDEAL